MIPTITLTRLTPALWNLAPTFRVTSSIFPPNTRRPFAVSSRLLVRNGPSPKAPRWVNQKSEKEKPATTPKQEEAPEEKEEGNEPEKSPTPASETSSTPSSSSSPLAQYDSDGDASSNSSPPPPSSPPSNPSSIAKQSVPEHYPQVLALPIARRPLFPGFYKAVVVRNPAVVAAIKEMMKRGQPYLGAFLLKDENTDSDVITDIKSVHQVGVFAQITSVFAAAGRGDDDKEEGLTAVLYPHRRIKITDLVKAGGAKIEEIEQQQQPQTVEPPTPPSTPLLEEQEQVADGSVTTAPGMLPSALFA
jgi:Lon-like ATP-dependent protease